MSISSRDLTILKSSTRAANVNTIVNNVSPIEAMVNDVDCSTSFEKGISDAAAGIDTIINKVFIF